MANKGIQKPRPRLPRHNGYAKVPSFNLTKRKPQTHTRATVSPESEYVKDSSSVLGRWFKSGRSVSQMLRAGAPTKNKNSPSSSVEAVLKSQSEADSRLTYLVELMYQSPAMFPTSYVDLRPYVRKSFLPTNQHATLPKPMSFRTLMEQKQDLRNVAYDYDQRHELDVVSKAHDVRDPSGSTTARTSQIYKESFNENFKLGSEHEARRRVRLIFDRLHGTAAGGRSGVSALKLLGKQ